MFALSRGLWHAAVAMRRQRVAVVGCGAVGLYYGARLAEAGHEVHFVMRRDYETCKRLGLRVVSPDGDAYFPPEQVHAHLNSASVGPVDWVMVALKTYSLPEVGPLIADLLRPDTNVLTVMNGLGMEDTVVAAGLCPPDRVFGGIAFICCSRGPPGSGAVHHQSHGPLHVGHVVDDPQRLREAAELFQGSKVKLTPVPCLLATRWEKQCWTIPFTGIATAMGGISVDKIVQNAELRELARVLVEEVLDIAEADLVKNRKAPLDRAATARHMFYLSDNMGAYLTSTVLDLLAGQRLEVEYLFGTALQRAEAMGVPCPTIRAVAAMVAARSAWQVPRP